MDLCSIKGIGARRRELLSELGILCVEDLLEYFPQTYLDYTRITPCGDLCEGDEATVCVTVLAKPTAFYRNGLFIVTARAADGSGKVALRWYNQPYRLRLIDTGMQVLAKGRVSCKRGVALLNPFLRQGGAGIEPVYAIKKGLTQRMMRDAVHAVLATAVFEELLPEQLRKRFDLPSKREAVIELHQPTASDMLASAQRRMGFERALLYFLAVSEQKERRKRAEGFAFSTAGVKEQLQSKLRFPLTDAQRRVLDEVAADMQTATPMNRLVQGDVGSGKTVIAFFALMVAAANGKQGAFLVPTEILARQHAKTLRELGIPCCVLLGGMPAAEQAAVLSAIADGSEAIIIGTHALFQQQVRFRDLGVVVTDEQHRFGVSQRAAMMDKGAHVDTLVMSATPIPRTLSLLLYSDLDLSAVDQMPPGRLPVKTHLIGQPKRKDLYRHLAAEAAKGRQSYVVCPLIDASEGMEGLSVQELSSELGELLPGTRMAVLHGRMHEQEKQNVMQRFASGEIGILIATTVIEVGVDVAAAANMVVEGAERFGLATLHQLRGRVGRGTEQSHCYLLPSVTGDAVMERLNILLSTTDGFRIAEQDMLLRGTGDLFGVRQHGKSSVLSLLDMHDAARVLSDASEAACEVLAVPSVINNVLMDAARKTYAPSDRVVMN